MTARANGFFDRTGFLRRPAMSLAICAGFALALPAAAATSCSGMGFYPPGDDPTESITLDGEVSQNTMHVTGITLSLDPLPGSLSWSPPAKALGLQDQGYNALEIDFAIVPNGQALSFAQAEVTVYYPLQLKDSPTVILKNSQTQLQAPGQRDPANPGVADVYAIFSQLNALAPAPLSLAQLRVEKPDGTPLEQANIQFPNTTSWTAMLNDAHQQLMESCQANAANPSP